MRLIGKTFKPRRRTTRSGRRFSVRGRLTLTGLFALFTLGLVFVWSKTASSPAEGLTSVFPVLEDELQAAPVELPPAAADLLGRLPVGVAHYDSFSGSSESPVSSGGSIRETHGPYTIEYSFDADLTRQILGILKRGRVKQGHVIVLDPHNGRLLAYVSTDEEAFPPQASYPSASLVKIVTAAAALEEASDSKAHSCVYTGNQYRLTRSSVHRPKRGHTVSLESALASSNNRCFAQLAVETLGADRLLGTLERFGWTRSPAAGHEAGSIDLGEGDYNLGRLGAGLASTRITPLHAAVLAASLASGEQVQPWWVDRVLDTEQRELLLPSRAAAQRVMTLDTAERLRKMLVRTTTHGTARSAFRDHRGRPRLGDVKVAGKTGNLTGTSPYGRYEWFVGLAPADTPSVAIAVLQLQSNLWWSKSSEIAVEVLSKIFCEQRDCEPTLAGRFTGDLGDAVAPVLLADPLGSHAQTDRPAQIKVR